MEKKNQTQGICKYCGQSMMIHLPEGWDPESKDQEEYDRLATEQCECERGKTEEQKKSQVEKAVGRMKDFYNDRIDAKAAAGGTYEEIEDLKRQAAFMKAAVRSVGEECVEAAHIALTPAEAFSVTYKKNGDLQIKRTFKGTEEWLF